MLKKKIKINVYLEDFPEISVEEMGKKAMNESRYQNLNRNLSDILEMNR